jgi:hypothetical protein
VQQAHSPNSLPCNVSDPSASCDRPLQKKARHDPSHVPSVEEVSNHGRLYDHINRGNRQQWKAACEHILSKYTLASIAENREEQTQCLAQLLPLPAQVLAKLPRGGRKTVNRGFRSTTTEISKRLLHLLRNQGPTAHSTDAKEQESSSHQASPHMHTHASLHPDLDLDSDLPINPLIPVPSSSPSSDVSVDPLEGLDLLISLQDKSAAGRADRLTRNGHVRKAAHVLNSTTEKADCSDPDVLETLHALHPQLPEDSLFPLSSPHRTSPTPH